jgi:hypothetical protein
MMVFTAALLKVLLSRNEMSTAKLLPTDENTTARLDVLNRLSTSRNVPYDLNRRCSSAKRLLKSIFIKVQINQKNTVSSSLKLSLTWHPCFSMLGKAT